MNDNSGIDYRDINMEIFNNFNQNQGSIKMWERYITDANEASIPQTFRASDEAIQQHNQEVYNLQGNIQKLDAETKQLKNLIRDMLFDIPVIPERHKYVEKLKEIT